MRILVIGRTGQLARALHELPPGDAELSFAGRDRLDLARPAAAAALVQEERPDLVLNAAAYTDVDRAESEPDLAYMVNAEAAGVLAGVAARTGAAFLQISTDYVFDGRGSRPWVETDATGPLSAYGRTKLAGEHLALAANPRTAVLRTSWLYSPWGRNFLRTMLEAGAKRRTLRIVADQVGCPTSAGDFARACLAIAPALAGAGPGDEVFGVTHCAAEGGCSWAGFAEAIFAGQPGPVPAIERISSAEWPTAARRPANSQLDCTRLAEVFGHRMPAWQDGLARVSGRIAVVATAPAGA